MDGVFYEENQEDDGLLSFDRSYFLVLHAGI